VDIRYVLWTIDVFAGAGHLVKEMTVVEAPVNEVKADANAVSPVVAPAKGVPAVPAKK
jgi:hypothetical protein